MFRTELTLPPSSYQLDYNHAVFTIGSCFAQVMGARMEENKFNVQVNPFGTIFNPISVFRLAEASIQNKTELAFSPVSNGELWFNYHAHSEFYGTSPEELRERFGKVVNESHEFIKKTNLLIITLGTAWVYELKKEKEIVANCHKAAADLFQKRLLSEEEIFKSFDQMYSSLRKLNPSVKILFTLSPVRHTKDTLPLNQVSKSLLRVAIHRLTEKNPELLYFPSYEIMMDDLRDYRFYKEDMIHPSEVADQYIWEKFSEVYLHKNCFDTMKQWEKLRRSLQHVSFVPESKAHKNFMKETYQQLQGLSGKIDVSVEMEVLKRRMEENN